MPSLLITGMSGSGKSTVCAELERRGHRVVDTESPRWSDRVVHPDGSIDYPWREDEIHQLLDGYGDGLLVLVGCTQGQGRFYDKLDAVVLLTAPPDVLLERIRTRSNNTYGKSPEQRALIERHVETVEPLLRESATVIIDTTGALPDVVSRIEELMGI